MASQGTYVSISTGSLARAVSQNWWLFLLRGIAAVAFGVIALFAPGVTLFALILLYGAYALTDGIFALAAGVMGSNDLAPRWWLLVVGLISISAGIATFTWPALTALILLFFIAGWAIATGVFQIAGAIRLRKEIENEWLLILNGALSVLFGVGMFVMPGAGALALIWVIALYAILFGILMIAFALTVRGYRPRT
jgi:uncharacterized membrane protein HdeD (DUF308 family)